MTFNPYNTKNDIVSWFRSLNSSHYTELLVFPLVIFLYIVSGMGFEVVTPRDALVGEMIRGIIIVVVGTTIIRLRMGANDFRFRLMVHILNIVFNVLMVTAGLDGDNVGDGELFLYLFILISHASITIAAIFSSFGLLDDYTTRLSLLNDEIKTGNMDARITDEQIITDKVLGSITRFINEILDNSSNLLKQVTETSNVIERSYLDLTTNSLEMNSSVDEVASTSQTMAKGATQQAEIINQIVQDMEEAAESINLILQQVQGNTELVTEIAQETKYLALNARIEAARAGASGRGFSVVAEDVKNLSEQSKLASEEINNVMGTITVALRDFFDKVKFKIDNVASVSEETAASAEEVAAAAEELASTIEEVNSLAQQLSWKIEKKANY